MHAMRQSMRPKHQVLVLKCYPKFQKGVSEVTPNPSELSYLLYYASTRRSKIQKVAAFLEKKSESDVYKLRIGNVQVTLHIIKALIEKSPRDLPLYAPHLLRIFNMILESKNLTLVEETVPAFQALCEHEDTTTLSANPALSKQFEDVVRGYASLAQQPPVQSKGTMSAPTTIRWKTAGLLAIKSITASEAIGTDRGRQLNIVMPVILENLFSDGEDRLVALNQKAEGEKELAIKRRMSISTTKTSESQADNKDAVVTDTAAESDAIAEEEAGLIAIQSLKQVFVANNRGQIRLATSALLKFLIDKTMPERPETANTIGAARPGTWTTTIVEMVTKWTPVQDRFIILITAVENLASSPVEEESMDKQLVLASMIEWLLSSSINMIGLSIMDVLLGLIQHILKLLQFGDNQLSTALPHHEQTEAIDLFKPEDQPGNRSSVFDILNSRSFEEVRPASLAHQQLLSRLRKCVGSLATHIYYSDQVSDLVSAILFRLKPNPTDPAEGAVGEKSAEAGTTEAAKRVDPTKNEFFSFGTARVAALNAIKDVITVANRRGSVVGAGVVGRNRIGVRVWEGTQWLLRDPDKRVRRAYAETLLIWLRLEVTKPDFRIRNDTGKVKKRKTVDFHNEKSEVPSRSVSSANPAGRHRSKRSTFLQLLHLAIYEDALEAPETDANILLLHLLLHDLVAKLGVNAVRTGLPMVRRLQEDINLSPLVNTPKAKINVGSLVHGYFWTCYNVFDFETTSAGYEVKEEIERRKKHGLWLTQVQVPPQNLDMIIAAYNAKPSAIPAATAQKEVIRPFDHIKRLVEQIAIAYDNQVQSPPASPPTSPGRGVLSVPKVTTPGFHIAAAQLPAEYREVMNAEWSKESCIAAAEKEAARSSSPAGSRSGTTRSQPQANGGLLAANGNVARDPSPAGRDVPRIDERPTAAMAHGLGRRGSGPGSNPATPLNGSSDHGATLRVDDLKRALAGGAMLDVFSSRPRSSARTASPLRNTAIAQQDFASTNARNRPSHGPSILSNTSESLVDAEGYHSVSEDDGDPLPPPLSRVPIQEVAVEDPPIQEPHAGTTDEVPKTPTTPSGEKDSSSRYSRGSRPRSSSDVSAEDPEANARALKGQLVSDVVRGSIVSDDGVPPVPPLPQNLMSRGSHSSNRQRGEALAPGIPYSGFSSGRSSAATYGRRSDAFGHGPLPPVTTSNDDAAAAAIAAQGGGRRRSSAGASPTPASPQQKKSPALAPAAFFTRDDRPESLAAAASANAAGAAAALAAIAAAGGNSRPSNSGTAGGLGAGLGGNFDLRLTSGKAPSYISSIGDTVSVGGGGGDVSALGSRSGSLKKGTLARPPTQGRDKEKERERERERADNKMLVQALLGSIEVGEVGGGKGIGRPPV